MLSIILSSLSNTAGQRRVKKAFLFSVLIFIVSLVYMFQVHGTKNRRLVKSAGPLNNSTSVREMLSQELDYSLDQVEYFKEMNPQVEKVKGVFLALVRNSELNHMVHTIKEIERSFNAKHQYPYLFLNDVAFSDEFISTISALTAAKVEFGLIPKEHWSIPDWIDKSRFKLRLTAMNFMGIPYGGLESYRHMCRFNSGFFYKHDLVQKYDYYWRVLTF